MTAIHYDARCGDEGRRAQIYAGDVHVISARPAMHALADWARELLVKGFGDEDPETLQHRVPVERFVELFAPIKPRFIHHPRTWELLCAVVREMGLDPRETYLDVPRLRGVTSHGYLTSGVGYAFPMHRDTWWAAPMQQINWWLPIFDIESANTMAFHPAWWNRAIENSSGEFDYYEYNRVARGAAAKQVKQDTRPQPRITLDPPPVDTPSVKLVAPVGGAILFSGQQLHSTVPNESGRTRFSIDFRTINIADVRAGRGAPNMDSAPAGTSLRDFRRVSDKARMPEKIALSVDPRRIPFKQAVFQPPASLLAELAAENAERTVAA